MLTHQNGYKRSQAKHSCGIERRLENEAIEKASVEGDVPQVATNLGTRESISLWCGYVQIRTTKTDPLCWRIGMLFVESTRLSCVGSITSPGHGSMVLATIKQAASPKTLWAAQIGHDVYLSCQDNIQWWQTKLHCCLTKFRLLSKSYFHPWSGTHVIITRKLHWQSRSTL